MWYNNIVFWVEKVVKEILLLLISEKGFFWKKIWYFVNDNGGIDV